MCECVEQMNTKYTKNNIKTVLMTMAIALSGHAIHAQDTDAGATVFKKCKACHKVGAGAKNGVGPHLNGVFGREAGSIPDFKYSKSMQRAGHDKLIWTDETLTAFTENPKSLVSKTKMSFRGIKDPQQIADLLAYLRTFSDDPSNIPEAEPTAKGTDHDIDPAILAIKGDPEYGEYLASECQTCHRVDGADEGIPAINGWPTEDFVVAMHAYKGKIRPHPVMQMMAGRLSNDEIAALAAYFEALE
jgi:cytochrome c